MRDVNNCNEIEHACGPMELISALSVVEKPSRATHRKYNVPRQGREPR